MEKWWNKQVDAQMAWAAEKVLSPLKNLEI